MNGAQSIPLLEQEDSICGSHLLMAQQLSMISLSGSSQQEQGNSPQILQGMTPTPSTVNQQAEETTLWESVQVTSTPN